MSGFEALYARIQEGVRGPVALMEVCGTHTMAIGRAGLRSRFPKDLRLISGPGCPVCVTPGSDLDAAIALAGQPGVRVATFGDLLRVPGTTSSLQAQRARGAGVLVVYSPMEALQWALAHLQEHVVFIGVGFETTSPTVAATVLRAAQSGVSNFSVLCSFKTVPLAMAALVAAGETRIDGFICPGHVSAIIGCGPYEPLGVPCVVTGFEPGDILEGVAMLLDQVNRGEARVQVQYRRAVPWEGNPQARRLLDEVFTPCDAVWRGIGPIPGTGLALRPHLSAFDARLRFSLPPSEAADLPAGCACGEVMRGLKNPPECALFGRSCTPPRPVGPCMVSSEGACAAWFRYGGVQE